MKRVLKFLLILLILTTIGVVIFHFIFQNNRITPVTSKQNTYRSEKVDALVAESIHRLFVYIKAIPEKEVIQVQVRRQEAFCQSQLEQAQRLFDNKNKELNDYQSEMLKVIRGESPLKMDIINGLVEQAEDAVKQTKADVAHWQEELSNVQTKGAGIHKFYGRVVNWSELFDKCSIA